MEINTPLASNARGNMRVQSFRRSSQKVWSFFPLSVWTNAVFSVDRVFPFSVWGRAVLSVDMARFSVFVCECVCVYGKKIHSWQQALRLMHVFDLSFFGMEKGSILSWRRSLQCVCACVCVCVWKKNTLLTSDNRVDVWSAFSFVGRKECCILSWHGEYMPFNLLLSCNHETCLMMKKHVSCSQDMSCMHDTCLMITKHVSCSQDTSCNHEICLTMTKHVSCSQDMSCNHKICPMMTGHVSCSRPMMTGHVSCSQDMSCNHRYVLWSRDMLDVHKTCLVITRYVLWSRNMVHVHKTCLLITKHVLSWGDIHIMTGHVSSSQDMSGNHKLCPVITRYVSCSQDMSAELKTLQCV